MKKFILVVILIVLAAGGVYLYQEGGKGASVSNGGGQPGNVTGDINACVGPKDYCDQIAEAKKLEIENQQKQYEQMLAAQAEPTPSPEDLAIQRQNDQANANAWRVFIYASVGIFILASLVFLFWWLYWRFRVKAPMDEVAPDIRANDKAIVIHLRPNTDDFNSRSQYIIIDKMAMGAHIVHIDGNGFAHQIKLDPEVAPYVAISNALAEAGKSNMSREVLRELLEQWSKASTNTIKALSDGAAEWRAAGTARARKQAASPALSGKSERKTDSTETWT